MQRPGTVCNKVDCKAVMMSEEQSLSMHPEMQCMQMYFMMCSHIYILVRLFMQLTGHGAKCMCKVGQTG